MNENICPNCSHELIWHEIIDFDDPTIMCFKDKCKCKTDYYGKALLKV